MTCFLVSSEFVSSENRREINVLNFIRSYVITNTNSF